MRYRWPASILIIPFLLVGCGSAAVGTYTAQAEQVADVARSDPGYTLADVTQKLQASPRRIILHSGSRFETRDGERVVWEGRWRTEGDRLVLRAQRVNGVDVVPKLQTDEVYQWEGGAIVDGGSYSAYGLRLVYRK